MYKKITKYYIKARERCTDIIKSTVYLTKELLLTEKIKLYFWHDLRRHFYGSFFFYEKGTRAKNFAKYHTLLLTTTTFITACTCPLTGIFWVLLGLYPMDNPQN
jgi:hypothetical protein